MSASSSYIAASIVDSVGGVSADEKALIDSIIASGAGATLLALTSKAEDKGYGAGVDFARAEALALPM